MPKQKTANTKYKIQLNQAEQDYLSQIIAKGKHSSRVITRARILLMSHGGQKDSAIFGSLGCSRSTVKTVRKRYHEREDIGACINDAPRPGQPIKITEIHKAHVVATSCTDPPEGHAHWTAAELRKDLLKTYTKLRSVSDEAIRQILVTQQIQPWREKNVVHSQTDSGVQGTDGGYPEAVHRTIAKRP